MNLRFLYIGLVLYTATIGCASRDNSAQAIKATVIEVELADPALAASAEKRHQLSYLVSCALPQHMVLYSQQGSERFTFSGQIGLAPGWLTQAMTSQEERWVSACMFAMTNHFGKHVPVSFRAKPAPVPFLKALENEKKRFSIFEGGFFGNLFAPHPVAYACRGEQTLAEKQDPVFYDRICTKVTDKKTAEGEVITPCQFVLTGMCTDPTSFVVDGQQYREVIFTYLQPGVPQ